MDTETIKYDLTSNQSVDFNSVHDVLRKVFKHDQFRNSYQRNAVLEACRFKTDLFVSLPTGSGKSLIYQLPAVYKNHGTVIVISPLVALMSNQLLNAKKLGIPAVTINSHMTKTWNQEVKNELLRKNCKIRLLYLTPETVCSDHFKFHLTTMDKNKTLKLFAIDEAHCVSSWGHEFRHDYLKLANLRTLCPNIPIVALTATATPKVLNDIIEVLKLKSPKHIVAPSFRKNLFYDVRQADVLEGQRLLQDIYEYIKKCLDIQDEDELSPSLKSTEEFDQVLLGKGHGRKKVIIRETAVGKPKGSAINSGSSSAFVSAASLLSEANNLVTRPKTMFLDSAIKSKTPATGSKRLSSGSLKLGSDIKQFLIKATNKVMKDEKTGSKSEEVIQIIDIDSDDDDGDHDKTKPTTIPKITKTTSTVGGAQFVSAASLMVGENMKSKDTKSTTTPMISRKRPHSGGIASNKTPKQHNAFEARRKSLIATRASNKFSSGVGIVYCRTKLYCEEVANYLSRKGISARPYHSSLTPKQRSEIERLWMDEEILIICATISFGMGIDKANVRVVIHYNMSQSLANYYQESGRAGRDGKRAYCRLYYTKSDQNAIVFLLRKNLDSEDGEGGGGGGGSADVGGYPRSDGDDSAGATKSRYDPANWRQLLPSRKVETARNAMARFEKMVEYCRSKQKCRHYLLAKEFAIKNETSTLIKGCMENCDICVGRPVSPQSFLETSYYD